jgi:hypothetical protein
VTTVETVLRVQAAPGTPYRWLAKRGGVLVADATPETAAARARYLERELRLRRAAEGGVTQ